MTWVELREAKPYYALIWHSNEWQSTEVFLWDLAPAGVASDLQKVSSFFDPINFSIDSTDNPVDSSEGLSSDN